jgi:putative membrane-bound dehydrogenase-like protein
MKRLVLILFFVAVSLTPTFGQGFSPEEAVRRMQPADGLKVSLVAAEPLVRQPLTMTFDDRGRMWVIQYLQYPTPAGLKPVQVDQFLRTKYDRIPEPPPKGPKGADRITILFDPDENGRFRQSKNFINGLNLASGLALGYDGAFVLQAPYLLFYSDKNHDDVPDGDPEVLLTGFGMEDAHAVGNSLIWGPDGWLYGAQGSTVTAKIKDPVSGQVSEFQQGVWRYHPRTKKFELFAEGGGNTWGLDFDRHGEIIAGTNWGGYACFHMVQGGYYVKGFAKHGPLHHPFAYGYFEHIPCEGFRGGHVTCGGIVYQGNLLPERFRDTYLACNLLDNNLYWYSLKRNGSTFTSKHEGTLLKGNDTWFRPIDLFTGPDGAVYIADWYDKRANHVDPVDNWDRSNGRIYRLGPSGEKRQGDKATRGQGEKKLGELSSSELVDLLKHPNSWQRGEARRILGERRDVDVHEDLQNIIIRSEKDDLALEATWALYASGGWDEQTSLALLQHKNAHIRSWTVRFIGEENDLSPSILDRLQQLAADESDPIVRSQLLYSLRRLPIAVRLRMLHALCRHEADVSDTHLPLLLWWLVESVFPEQQSRIVSFLSEQKLWDEKLVERVLLERIVRRMLTTGPKAASKDLATLLRSAPTSNAKERLLQGMEQALTEKPLTEMPSEIASALAAYPESPLLLRIKLLCDEQNIRKTAWDLVGQESIAVGGKAKVLQGLAAHLRGDEVPRLFSVVKSTVQPEPIRLAASAILEGRTESSIVPFFLEELPHWQGALRRRVINYLTLKSATVAPLLQLIATNDISPKELSIDQVQRLSGMAAKDQKGLIEKFWGAVRPATSGEKRARINSVLHMLGQGKGNVGHGAALFKQHCANCHTIFGAGGKVGPDLTSADRSNTQFLADNIVDPSRVIRPEFLAFVCVTKDGRTLTGLVTDETANTLTIVDEKTKTTLRRDEIDDIKVSDKSLMPEGLLDPLDDQQIRDLFAYVQQPEPKKGSNGEPPAPDLVPNTSPLTDKIDFADKMVSGIDRFLMKEIAASAEKRGRYWKRDTSSPEAYVKSVEPNRQRLRQVIGAVDQRARLTRMEIMTSVEEQQLGKSASFATSKQPIFEEFKVRWRSFGLVDGEGILLVPRQKPAKADVVVIPDADETPEQVVEATPNKPLSTRYARQLAENGCRVIVVSLLNRSNIYSGVPGIRSTNEPHREWLYRQAFEMGRHPLGYEVQKVLSAIDWLEQSQNESSLRPSSSPLRKVAILGYGEGGVVALLAGALDTRINLTAVSGSFGHSERLWEEPIDRNVWRYLKEFGDAEVASLIGPRDLIVDTIRPGPTSAGPPAPKQGQAGTAAPGTLRVHDADRVQLEVNKLERLLDPLRGSFVHVVNRGERSPPEDYDQIARQVLQSLGVTPKIEYEKGFYFTADALLTLETPTERQLRQLVDHTQTLRRQSEAVREKNFWNKIDKSNLDKYQASTAPFRKQLEEEVIGKIEQPLSPAKPRSRKLYEEPTYTAYEVELDVIAPDVIAYGWLLVPKDIKPNEKRPVVVCQHGLEGRPGDVADPKKDNPAYHRFACQLAQRGFVVFAPQNPYIFGDRFRVLQRKANPLGLSLFSFIVAPHRQITDWLACLPFVDPDRIGFYGLSYGGKTAMRVPALVPRYCLSICSADFNEWIWKNASVDNKYTYLLTNEYEMSEWNLGHTLNYAEMAALVAPRPFMVERGHHDGVALDEQVAYEYAKVRRLYAELKIPERTEIEFFDGPHTIHGVGTFKFLHKHLRWPEKGN